MTDTHQKDETSTTDLAERLRTMAAMISMGERILLGQDTAVMEEAAAEIERLRAKLADAKAVIAPLINRYNEITQITRGRRWATYVEMDHLRAAAEWMGDGDGPGDMQTPLGARFSIDHDGFVGTVIGYYRRHDGKRGVVLQQDGTKVVHVYGEKWLKAEKNR